MNALDRASGVPLVAPQANAVSKAALTCMPQMAGNLFSKFKDQSNPRQPLPELQGYGIGVDSPYSSGLR